MFFNLHEEKKIGFKKLSDADLGLGASHQTHIGLYGDTFTFLHDKEVETNSYLIYNNNIDVVDCYFDRIQNKDGSFRSPKIRKGERNAVSVVTIIRDTVKEKSISEDWFLIWFGLENEDMVFYFFNRNSKDYEEISGIIDLNTKGRIDVDNSVFPKLLDYLEEKVNKTGSNIIKELETASQVGSTKKFKPFDLEKANKIYKEIGQRGEALIDDYLNNLKNKNQIFNYTWYNKSLESGLPYDFSIQEKNQNVIYIDVKTTNFHFDQPLIFSNQEIQFINNTINYNIYRVYNLNPEDECPKLRICNNGTKLSNYISPNINELEIKLKDKNISLRNMKLAVRPSNEFISFENEILL